MGLWAESPASAYWAIAGRKRTDMGMKSFRRVKFRVMIHLWFDEGLAR